MPNVIPLSEAAKTFELSEMTLYRYLKRGLLKRYRKGADPHTFVDKDELRRLLHEAREAPAKRAPRPGRKGR